MLGRLSSLRYYAYVGLACLVLGFAWGWHAESVRYAEYRGAVEAVGKAQEQRTKERMAEARLRRKEADEAHRKALARLAARHDAALKRMRDDADRRLVPAIPTTPADSNQLACFDRGRLNDELTGVLRRHAERLGGIATEGEGAVAAFKTCAAWALREWKGQ